MSNFDSIVGFLSIKQQRLRQYNAYCLPILFCKQGCVYLPEGWLSPPALKFGKVSSPITDRFDSYENTNWWNRSTQYIGFWWSSFLLANGNYIHPCLQVSRSKKIHCPPRRSFRGEDFNPLPQGPWSLNFSAISGCRKFPLSVGYESFLEHYTIMPNIHIKSIKK